MFRRFREFGDDGGADTWLRVIIALEALRQEPERAASRGQVALARYRRWATWERISPSTGVERFYAWHCCRGENGVFPAVLLVGPILAEISGNRPHEGLIWRSSAMHGRSRNPESHRLRRLISTVRYGAFAILFGAPAVVGFSAPANADILWNFNFSGHFPTTFGPHAGETDIITGQLTTSALDPGNNTYTILSVTGTDNGSAITGLLSEAYTDNLLFADAPYLDFNGFAFADAAGDNINLYYNNAANGHYWDWFDQGETAVTDGTFTVSQATPANVPEPASLALFGMGLAGLAVTRRRKRA